MIKSKKVMKKLKRSLKGNIQDVEDVIQEGYLRMLEKKSKGFVTRTGNDDNYLYSMMENITKNYLKSSYKKTLDTSINIYDSDITTFNNPMKRLVERDINKFLDTLSNNQREVFKKRLELDSHKEVAEALNKNYMTCKSHWNFALKKFKESGIL